MLQGALGHQEDIQGHARRRRQDAPLRPSHRRRQERILFLH
uniref:Uncharacterized protein n=1 Tax=Arundo donax TaxID=35708 RepID=A0A0A9BUT9_ARUDO